MTDIVERLRKRDGSTRLTLMSDGTCINELGEEAAAEIERLRAANIGLATESHELQQEVERLGSVADAEMKLREGNFAEIERLRAALREILNFSDLEMADGDGARRVARTALAPGDV